MDGPDDSELLSRFRDGDQDAFAMLVSRHADPIAGYLGRLAGSRSRAEDLLQETFVRLHLRPPRLEAGASAGPWLYRVATNLLRSEERRARLWRRLTLGLAAPERDPAPDPEQAAALGEDRARLAGALAALPLDYRSALLLREVEGLEYDAIARALDVPIGTVRSRLARGREILRRTLGEAPGAVVAPARLVGQEPA